MRVTAFLHAENDTPIWDVRSPSEYKQGHIPGSINVPLFDDPERVRIGTLYKNVSQEEAFKTGLEIVGPKMRAFVERAEETAINRRIRLHCWRGGQRSSALAWLLRMSGFNVDVLEGGYKAYRRHILDQFHKLDVNLLIIGGPTGSGKTDIIQKLESEGEQTLDLEQLANHRGSSFGGIGQGCQPTSEQFENDLYDKLVSFDFDRPIWIENESRGIGKVFIPDGFWDKMQESSVYEILLDTNVRIERLINEYANYSDEALVTAFERIKKRLGGLRLQNALKALHEDNYAEAARIALEYYDKSYRHHVERSQQNIVFSLPLERFEEKRIATTLIEKCYTLNE